MTRVYNFSAGPAVLPESVLEQAAAEMLDYQGTGMSVMEMSHRSKPFQNIIDTAEADLRGIRRQLRSLGDYRNIYVHDPHVAQHALYFGKQLHRIRTFIFIIGIRKMSSDISQSRCPEQRVHQRVYCYIRI